jgi:acetyl-CoA acetyltransferase
MREVVLVSSVRTPVGRAFKGTLRATRPDELAAMPSRAHWRAYRNLIPRKLKTSYSAVRCPRRSRG